ncbi:Inner membrane transport permease YhhJ [Shewanella sp. P1-14-1]|uniref:ABC transporter permease n=1 Tax=Shewanella sp. P1-14-1 TaxID=1723761 RepID=UPI0006D683D8|nr:ABC transporter permease [Shewanella sp. P1-14-1]KPZ73255.1 Inner membrane transport permease YhhJ [Shewanella sp. P1-14-1]
MRVLLKQELKRLWCSPWQLALVTYIPLISILCLWWLFSAGLPRQLPVAVVDQDNSQLTRTLTRNLAANAVIKPITYTQFADAKAAMTQAEVYAVVVFPHEFKRKLLTGSSPTVDIRYNSQFLLVGKLLSSQLQLSVGAGLMEVAGMKQLLNGANRATVAVNLSPVTSQTTALFNRNNNYVGFLVPPVLIALLQLLAMMVFVNSLNDSLIRQGEQYLLPAKFWWHVGAKVLFYTPVMLVHGGFILAWLYGVLRLPIAGNLLLLIAAQAMMFLALWTLVILVFLLMREPARSVSFCTALFAPAFAFMGITFPVNDMPELAQWWRLIMPSSHYIDSHVSIISYGAGALQVLQQSISYGYFIIVLALAWGLHRVIWNKQIALTTTSQGEAVGVKS